MTSNTGKELSRRVIERYLIAGDEEHLLSAHREIEASLPAPLREVSSAFVHNIRALVASATIPFQLVWSSVNRERFQRMHLAERFRAKAECVRAGEESKDSFISREAELRAYERAGEKFKAELAASSELVDRTCEYLLQAYETESFAVGARELLRQAAVLSWAAFEVLSRDLLRVYLNLRPHAAVDLAHDASTARLFQFKSLDLQALADLGFDLSAKMGELVASTNDLSRIETIRAVYKAMLGEHEAVTLALSDRRLWNLCQTRHLMVHRRGVADHKFIRDTGSDLQVGSPVYVSPDELESYVDAVVRATSSMLAAVSGLLGSPPNTPLRPTGPAGG